MPTGEIEEKKVENFRQIRCKDCGKIIGAVTEETVGVLQLHCRKCKTYRIIRLSFIKKENNISSVAPVGATR
jgi:phage FluMu protein Com